VENITHKGAPTSQEIWDGIRYLDPDVPRIQPTPRPADAIASGIVAAFLTVGICIIALALYLHPG
jgi:hypothetical protein